MSRLYRFCWRKCNPRNNLLENKWLTVWKVIPSAASTLRVRLSGHEIDELRELGSMAWHWVNSCLVFAASVYQAAGAIASVAAHVWQEGHQTRAGRCWKGADQHRFAKEMAFPALALEHILEEMELWKNDQNGWYGHGKVDLQRNVAGFAIRTINCPARTAWPSWRPWHGKHRRGRSLPKERGFHIFTTKKQNPRMYQHIYTHTYIYIYRYCMLLLLQIFAQLVRSYPQIDRYFCRTGSQNQNAASNVALPASLNFI